MTQKSSLPAMLESMNRTVEARLREVRTTIGHSGTKGDASEEIWLGLLRDYLPKRYQAERAFVVDSLGKVSDQIDIVVFDRQYSPFVFVIEKEIYVPAESVYAAFECKQSIDASLIGYARSKILSVRHLTRTSLPVPHSDGAKLPKELHNIIGGILSLESEWSPPMGDSLLKALGDGNEIDSLDLGCVAAHGFFGLNPNAESYELVMGKKPATGFLFELIARLQVLGTVPVIDIRAYSSWL
mgnify:CR=1 FL=1|tara:strand:+ start:196 stop:918 length:723 start_codon:yes stop_codon:yes gene_type:complete